MHISRIMFVIIVPYSGHAEILVCVIYAVPVHGDEMEPATDLVLVGYRKAKLRFVNHVYD